MPEPAASPAPAPDKPRLNPFAFPSQTDFRFWLLIAAVLGSSLFAYSLLYFDRPANQQKYAQLASLCLAESSALQAPGPTGVITAWAGVDNCLAPVNREIAAWQTAGLALLLAFAGALYWFYPGWKIRRDQLVPITAEDAPEVLEELAALSRAAGLRQPPVFLWNPLNLTPGGLAFGRMGRYYISLTGGLVTLFYTDLPAFRAVVLHELAHLHNRDIDKTYFTVAVWRAFLLFALLPMVVSLFGIPLQDLLGLAWRIAVLALFVYLTRNAVLRTRELYADVRASTWEESRAALDRAIAGLSAKRPGPVKGLLQVHPDPAYRRRVMADTSLLFRMSFWDSLATGIAATISFPFLEALWNNFITDAALLSALLAGAVLGALAAGIVGLEIWRAVFAAKALGRPYGSLIPASLGLGLGILLGRNLSFVRYVETAFIDLSLLDQALRFVFNLAWFGILATGLLLLLSWTASTASSWLEVAARRSSPRKVTAAGLAAAGVLLVVWLSPLLWLAKYDGDPGEIGLALLSVVLGVPVVAASNPLTLLAVVCIWAFPLGAWFWRRQAAQVSRASWAYLDRAATTVQIPDTGIRPQPLRPGRAFSAGIAAGLLFCVAILAVRLLLRLGLPEATRDTDQYALFLFYGQIITAVILQAVLAAAVAAWSRRLGLAHGLFAAFVAGAVSGLGMLVVNLLLGGTLDPFFAWSTFSLTVTNGALLSIPVAALASFAGSWLRRQSAASPRAYELAQV